MQQKTQEGWLTPASSHLWKQPWLSVRWEGVEKQRIPVSHCGSRLLGWGWPGWKPQGNGISEATLSPTCVAAHFLCPTARHQLLRERDTWSFSRDTVWLPCPLRLTPSGAAVSKHGQRLEQILSPAQALLPVVGEEVMPQKHSCHSRQPLSY